jgi:hypothetical protein
MELTTDLLTRRPNCIRHGGGKILGYRDDRPAGAVWSAPRLSKAQDAQLHVFPQATILPYLHHVAAPVLVFEQAAHLADSVMRAVLGPAADPGLPIPTAAHREERHAGTGGISFSSAFNTESHI